LRRLYGFRCVTLTFDLANLLDDIIIIIIVIERKDLGGVMSTDCKDTLQTLKTVTKTRVRRKVRTEYQTDAIVGRAVEIRKTSDEQFRLQLTSKGRQ